MRVVSVANQFGFRIDAKTKLMFYRDKPTTVKRAHIERVKRYMPQYLAEVPGGKGKAKPVDELLESTEDVLDVPEQLESE